MLVTERHMMNKDLYKLVKKATNHVFVSVGNGFDDYENKFYYDVNIGWYDKNLDFGDATTISYYCEEAEKPEAEKKALKQAKIIVRVLEKYMKVDFEGLENA